MKHFRKLVGPYCFWLFILTIIPMFLIMMYAFIQKGNAITTFSFTLDNFSKFFDPIFVSVLIKSFVLGIITTVLCLLIGYPIAYFISRSHFKNKYLILLIFIMPMWTNMLLRIQTINRLLSANSFFTNVFNFTIDLSNQKDLKIIAVMTLVYLPFMIFPIYTVLEKMDKSLYEASNDLGAGSIKTFFKVTLPISSKGIYSGVMMVFLPAAMGFTIPQIVTDGDTNYTMVGQLIERQFKNSTTFFNTGSMWSLIIIIFVLGSLYVISKIDEDGETLL